MSALENGALIIQKMLAKKRQKHFLCSRKLDLNLKPAFEITVNWNCLSETYKIILLIG